MTKIVRQQRRTAETAARLLAALLGREAGRSYDELEAELEASRATVRRFVRAFEDLGVIERVREREDQVGVAGDIHRFRFLNERLRRQR